MLINGLSVIVAYLIYKGGEDMKQDYIQLYKEAVHIITNSNLTTQESEVVLECLDTLRWIIDDKEKALALLDRLLEN